MTNIAESAPAGFHLLAKPTGAVCNLDCQYCFFLSKEELYPGSPFRMTDEVLEAYIQQLLEAHSHAAFGTLQAPEVIVAWQGGEPTLMGLDFFRRSVDLVEKHKKPGQTVAYTIQTNGTKVDDAWAAFFKEHNFLVGLSVDGPRELHDAYRVDKGGAGSFERVMAGRQALRRHQVDVNILCTVNAANADHPVEVYRFFRDELDARGGTVYRGVADKKTSLTERGLIVYRFDAPLVFANAAFFTERLEELVSNAGEGLQCVILDAEAISDFDSTAAEALENLDADLERRAVELWIARANEPLRELLQATGLTKRLGKQNIYPSVRAAVAAYHEQFGSS